MQYILHLVVLTRARIAVPQLYNATVYRVVVAVDLAGRVVVADCVDVVGLLVLLMLLLQHLINAIHFTICSAYEYPRVRLPATTASHNHDYYHPRVPLFQYYIMISMFIISIHSHVNYPCFPRRDFST